MAGTIVFNGKTYNSVDEMPPEVRQAYEKVVGLFADKNQNGIPDVLEGIGSVNRQNINIKKKTTAIIYDGKKYDNVEQVPPEARQKYEQAMGKLDADKDGIPDFIEGMMGTSSASTMTSELPASQPVFSQPSTVSVNSPSAIEPENNSLRWLIIGIGLIIVLCMGAIGMWVLFGR